MKHTHAHTSEPAPLNTDVILTKAETKVASGYVAGLIGKEIADTCGISYNTVVRHMQNIYEKTGIGRSTNALVAWFLSENFHIDLAEFRRRVGAAILLAIVSVQIAGTDFSNMPVRRIPARRPAPVRRAGRRNRKDDDIYFINA